MLRVKGVPLLYMPFLYYPIRDDERQTGFLMPTYGTSTLRGQAISNAFFWAIDRSQDATFFHDWFTRTGQGYGSEYRYVSGPQSDGIVRIYRFDQKQAQFQSGTSTNTLPASQSLELTANANQLIMPWDGVKFDSAGQNTLGRGILVQIVGGQYHTVWPFNLATRDVAWPMPKWDQRK